jgi:hypothetical protein
MYPDETPGSWETPMSDGTMLTDWVRRRLHRSSEVASYDPGLVSAPAVVRLWRTLTRYGRRSRRALPRCKNCGYLIAQAVASPTGWTHGPHWQGVRCPGDATGAEPRPGVDVRPPGGAFFSGPRR